MTKKKGQEPPERAHLIWPPVPKPGRFRLRNDNRPNPEKVAERRRAVRITAERAAQEDAARRERDSEYEPILDNDGRIIGRKRCNPTPTPGVVHHAWRREHVAIVGRERPPDPADSDVVRIMALERQVAQLQHLLGKDSK